MYYLSLSTAKSNKTGLKYGSCKPFQREQICSRKNEDEEISFTKKAPGKGSLDLWCDLELLKLENPIIKSQKRVSFVFIDQSESCVASNIFYHQTPFCRLNFLMDDGSSWTKTVAQSWNTQACQINPNKNFVKPRFIFYLFWASSNKANSIVCVLCKNLRIWYDKKLKLDFPKSGQNRSQNVSGWHLCVRYPFFESVAK